MPWICGGLSSISLIELDFRHFVNEMPFLIGGHRAPRFSWHKMRSYRTVSVKGMVWMRDPLVAMIVIV